MNTRMKSIFVLLILTVPSIVGLCSVFGGSDTEARTIFPSSSIHDTGEDIEVIADDASFYTKTFDEQATRAGELLDGHGTIVDRGVFFNVYEDGYLDHYEHPVNYLSENGFVAVDMNISEMFVGAYDYANLDNTFRSYFKSDITDDVSIKFLSDIYSVDDTLYYISNIYMSNYGVYVDGVNVHSANVSDPSVDGNAVTYDTFTCGSVQFLVNPGSVQQVYTFNRSHIVNDTFSVSYSMGFDVSVSICDIDGSELPIGRTNVTDFALYSSFSDIPLYVCDEILAIGEDGVSRFGSYYTIDNFGSFANINVTIPVHIYSILGEFFIIDPAFLSESTGSGSVTTGSSDPFTEFANDTVSKYRSDYNFPGFESSISAWRNMKEYYNASLDSPYYDGIGMRYYPSGYWENNNVTGAYSIDEEEIARENWDGIVREEVLAGPTDLYTTSSGSTFKAYDSIQMVDDSVGTGLVLDYPNASVDNKGYWREAENQKYHIVDTWKTENGTSIYHYDTKHRTSGFITRRELSFRVNNSYSVPVGYNFASLGVGERHDWTTSKSQSTNRYWMRVGLYHYNSTHYEFRYMRNTSQQSVKMSYGTPYKISLEESTMFNAIENTTFRREGYFHVFDLSTVPPTKLSLSDERCGITTTWNFNYFDIFGGHIDVEAKIRMMWQVRFANITLYDMATYAIDEFNYSATHYETEIINMTDESGDEFRGYDMVQLTYEKYDVMTWIDAYLTFYYPNMTIAENRTLSKYEYGDTGRDGLAYLDLTNVSSEYSYVKLTIDFHSHEDDDFEDGSVFCTSFDIFYRYGYEYSNTSNIDVGVEMLDYIRQDLISFHANNFTRDIYQLRFGFHSAPVSNYARFLGSNLYYIESNSSTPPSADSVEWTRYDNPIYYFGDDFQGYYDLVENWFEVSESALASGANFQIPTKQRYGRTETYSVGDGAGVDSTSGYIWNYIYFRNRNWFNDTQLYFKIESMLWNGMTLITQITDNYTTYVHDTSMRFIPEFESYPSFSGFHTLAEFNDTNSAIIKSDGDVISFNLFDIFEEDDLGDADLLVASIQIQTYSEFFPGTYLPSDRISYVGYINPLYETYVYSEGWTSYGTDYLDTPDFSFSLRALRDDSGFAINPDVADFFYFSINIVQVGPGSPILYKYMLVQRENIAPWGAISYRPAPGGMYPGQAMVFRDSGTMDVLGEISEVQVDYGDGVTEEFSGTQSKYSHRYLEAGKYTAKFKFYDDEDWTSDISIDVAVSNEASYLFSENETDRLNISVDSAGAPVETEFVILSSGSTWDWWAEHVFKESAFIYLRPDGDYVEEVEKNLIENPYFKTYEDSVVLTIDLSYMGYAVGSDEFSFEPGNTFFTDVLVFANTDDGWKVLSVDDDVYGKASLASNGELDITSPISTSEIIVIINPGIFDKVKATLGVRSIDFASMVTATSDITVSEAIVFSSKYREVRTRL